MKLIIFDLDQTLVDFISVHDDVMQKLFRKYFGVSARLTEIDFAGRNLSDNLTELVRKKHISETKFNLIKNELLVNYEKIFTEITPDEGSRYILPGARELLKKLSGLGHIIALYTGSPQHIVSRVLDTTGLGKYFNIVFTGSEEKPREEMVQAAIQKAEEISGYNITRKKIVLIGDSVRDVQAGKRFGALTVAVATGFHSKDALLKSEADYVFDGMQAVEPILKAIES